MKTNKQLLNQDIQKLNDVLTEFWLSNDCFSNKLQGEHSEICLRLGQILIDSVKLWKKVED